jgi:UDP-N-acetylmuramoylalanine--D-glutamate ligase
LSKVNRSFVGKKVTVFGVKKSGKAAIDLLIQNGAKVYATEKSSEIDSSLLIWLEDLGVPFELGFHSRKAIDGKDLIVLSPGVDPNIPILRDAKRNHIPIIGEIELAYQFSDASFVAVTGTSGKSTTVELVGKIVGAHQAHVYVCGNIGIPISEIISANHCHSTLIVEVSSFQLETIQQFKPKVAVFLNFSQDHLDRYPTMDAYFHAKMKIFENQTKDDFALLNADSETLSQVNLQNQQIYYFSVFRPVEKGFFLKSDQIVIREPGREDLLISCKQFKLPGLHNKMNAISAVGASYLFLGSLFSKEKTEKALAEFKGLEHRFEFIGTYLGVDFINDSKSTKPGSTIVAIQCINQSTILIIGGSEKGNDYSEMIKVIAQNSYIKYVVITGKTQKKVKSGFESLGFKKYKTTPTFKSAVFEAIARAREGDLVLLSPACASFDEFRDFEERGEYFKKLVHQIYSNKEK